MGGQPSLPVEKHEHKFSQKFVHYGKLSNLPYNKKEVKIKDKIG
jgi:hypothetical protein